MSRVFDRADARPRVHIFPHSEAYRPGACQWSIGPNGLMAEADTAGAALDAALARLGQRGNVVVIVEPMP